MSGTALAAIVALALVMTGCSMQHATTPSASSTTSDAVVFRDDAEALQSAKRVYEEYLEIGEDVSRSGGQGVRKFEAILAPDAYAEEQRGAKVLVDRGLFSTGETRLKTFKLQRVDLRTGDIAAYACLDLSAVRVKTDTGEDVTPSSRPDEQTLRPTFVWRSGRLLLAGNGTWSGASVC